MNKLRQWTTVSFEIVPEHEDLASWLMIQCGSIGVQVVEQPDPNILRIEATFDQEKMTEELLKHIKVSLEEYGLAASLSTLRYKTLEEEDWLSKWKEGFEPFQIGQKLVVCPPWSLDDLDAKLSANRHVLILEPGMAFGTGLHATTRYCMESIEKLLNPRMVLDVGTGSGILAIACKFLFPSAQVSGVDPDPIAIAVAVKNLELNSAREVDLICGTTDDVRGKNYDVLLSNLTCEDIISLLPDYETLLTADGIVICAGILMEKVDKLESALNLRGWRILSVEKGPMWCGMTIAYAKQN